MAITTVGEGDNKHHGRPRDFIGQDAAVLAHADGKNVPATTELLFGETDESNPFVPRRTDDALRALRPLPRRRRSNRQGQALRTWLPAHGHHSLEQCPQHDQDGPRLDTTLFVKNGPCMAAWDWVAKATLFSIATPTGEGFTTPLTFTRERRCSMIDDLRILGNNKADTGIDNM